MLPVLPFVSPSFPPGMKNYPNILAHELVEKELKELIDENPEALAQLESNYEKRLDFLSRNLGRETAHTWFEFLEGSSYKSMRFVKVKLLKNLRILYGIADNKAYLLVAFTEKRRKSDYAHALKIAENRAKGIL